MWTGEHELFGGFVGHQYFPVQIDRVFEESAWRERGPKPREGHQVSVKLLTGR